MAGLSPKLPLGISETDGAYGLTKTIRELTLQNLKNLILTCPGERMMDPLFGVGMRNFIFSQNTPFTQEDISTKIREQVAIYMDYIEINAIIFNEGDLNKAQFETNSLSIVINFTIIPLNIVDILALPI